jgi:hypothetical protein
LLALKTEESPGQSTSAFQRLTARRKWIGQVADELIRLATQFADALTEAGVGDELHRRAREFEALTGSGSPFDQARLAVLAELGREGVKLYLRDHSERLLYQRRVIDFSENGHGFVEITNIYPNYLPKVRDRLADPEPTRWDLTVALEDAEAILRIELSPDQEAIFKPWRQVVWEAVVRSERGHLFGSYLLAECQRAMSLDERSREAYLSLRSRLEMDPPRLARAIQEAAGDLQTAGGPAREAPPPGPAAERGGYHPESEPRPAEFTLGPLVGNLKVLAAVIGPSFGYGKDRRSLQRLGKDNAIWVGKVRGQCYKVFFRGEDRTIYATANQAYMERKQRKAPSNRQDQAN